MNDPLKAEVEVIEDTPKDPVPSNGPPKAPPPTTVVEAAKPVKRPAPKPKAKPSQLDLSPEGAKFVTVQYLMDNDHKLEDLFEPEYWAHVANKFEKPIGGGDYTGSIIEVRKPDNTMFARFFIRQVQERALVLALMDVYWFGHRALKSKEYKDRWNPGARKFEVIRLSDGDVVFQSKLREKCIEYVDKTKG